MKSKNKNLEAEVQQLKEQLTREVQARDDIYNLLHTRIDKAIEVLSSGVTFCENDSQGVYDKCNIAINREKKAVAILKGEE